SNSSPSPSLRKTFSASAMISGPMPSPGRTATLILEVPGMLLFSPGLECADLVRVAQREADLVQPVQQAVLAERVDVEVKGLFAVDSGDRLALQVDEQAQTGKRVALVEQAIDLGLGQDHRKKAVLERVGEEDVGERGRDHAAKAVVDERPRRVLARGAATEVLARKENGRALVARLVQDELAVLAPLGEESLREAGALDRREVLLRDDLVGVDVGAVEGGDQAVQYCEFLHLINSRGECRRNDPRSRPRRP